MAWVSCAGCLALGCLALGSLTLGCRALGCLALGVLRLYHLEAARRLHAHITPGSPAKCKLSTCRIRGAAVVARRYSSPIADGTYGGHAIMAGPAFAGVI